MGCRMRKPLKSNAKMRNSMRKIVAKSRTVSRKRLNLRVLSHPTRHFLAGIFGSFCFQVGHQEGKCANLGLWRSLRHILNFRDYILERMDISP